jgi:hypothetical protein
VNAAHSRGPQGPVVRRSHSSRVAVRSMSKVSRLGSGLSDGERLGVSHSSGVKRLGAAWGELVRKGLGSEGEGRVRA